MAEDKNLLSIDCDDNDHDNYKTFKKYLKDDAERKKATAAREIDTLGDLFISEIEKKQVSKSRQKKIKKYIKYILKHDKAEQYTRALLESYDFYDIAVIHKETRIEVINSRKKIFQFLFNQ